MQNNFLPLTEIQKMLVFSPIKTYRLFVKFKQEGRLREEQDWMVRDQKLFLDLPRFYTELEADGYKNVLQDDFKSFQMNSFENIRDQMISDERGRDQTENSQLDNSQGKSAEKIHSEESNLRSDEIIRNQMNPNESEMKSDDIKSANLISAEIVRAKSEVIDVLKESLRQANEHLAQTERDKEHYRKEMEYISQQNQRLTQLTYMLTAPKQEPAARDATRDRTTVYTGPVGEQREEEEIREPEVRDAEAPYEETPAEPLPEEQSVHGHVPSEEGRGEPELPHL